MRYEVEVRLITEADSFAEAYEQASKVGNYACETVGMEEQHRWVSVTEILGDFDSP